MVFSKGIPSKIPDNIQVFMEFFIPDNLPRYTVDGWNPAPPGMYETL